MFLIPYIFPFSPYAYENWGIEMLNLYPSIPSPFSDAQIQCTHWKIRYRQQGKTNKLYSYSYKDIQAI